VTIILILVSFVQTLIGPKGAVGEKATKVPETPPASVREEKLRLVRELEEKGEGDAGYELLEKGLRRKRLVQSVIIILISLGIGYLGGFLLTVPFYFITFGLLHGQKRQGLRYIVIAIVITGVIYLFFTHLMGVPLLRGIWWG
jgi:VIT1/CCC1 family predicted Fe2+/Mn2+ transporter